MTTYNVFFFKLIIYFERERAHKWGRLTERERERIPSRLRAVCAESNAGLDPMNYEIMT